MSKLELKEVEHYHNIRNKIYHLGEGIVPAKEKFDGYLQLADKVLSHLVYKNPPEKKGARLYNSEDELEVFRILGLALALGHLRKDFQDFKVVITCAAEAVNPKYTTRKIEAGLQELLSDEDIDTCDLSIEEKYDERLRKIDEFNKLTGLATKDTNFIDKVIYDVTYLYLLTLIKNNKIENEDLNKYLEYREFVEKFSDDPEKATMEDKEKLGQFLDWAKTIGPKLYSLYNDQQSG